MKIFVLQTGEPIQSDSLNRRPMRGINLTNAFTKKGHNVTFISSQFSHQDKKHRSKKVSFNNKNNLLKIELISSPGYKKNISFIRLYDHFVMAVNLIKYLKNVSTKPDFIFVGYPPIEVATVMIWWSKINNIPCYLDIKDKWPHYFLTKFPNIIRPLIKLFLLPYFLMAKYSIRNATAVVSMSNSFLNWARNLSRKQNNNYIVLPLSPPENKFELDKEIDVEEWWINKIPNLGKIPTFSFIGSISEAFDFDLIKGLAIMMEKNHKKCNFVICGEGELFEKTKSSFKHIKNTHFTGWINTKQIAYLMIKSSATLAPYKNHSNFTDNLPNKILDSLSFGNPIFSSLKGEVENLIKLRKVGLFCDDNPYSWYSKINEFIDNKNLEVELSRNATNVFKSQFSYEKVYGNFVESIEKKFN